jgi:N-acetylglucosamine-6-sulfatase
VRGWGYGSALTLVGLAVVALSSGGAAGQVARKPNVVVVMTDDQDAASLRVMPSTRALIGSAGVTFARSFASYPLCCPSRATFLTGQHAHNHKVLDNDPPDGGYGVLAGKDNTLPVWLQRAGYHTVHVGKYLNHYGLSTPPHVPPGWDEWHGEVGSTSPMMWGYVLSNNGETKTYGEEDVEAAELYQDRKSVV